MKELKKISNCITLIRFILVPLLWVLAIFKQNFVFGIFFALAGITDFLDGSLARRLKEESNFGRWFDSLADTIILFSAVFWIWLLLPEFFNAYLWIFIMLFVFFILDVGIGFIKYKQLVVYHLYSAKIATVIAYVFLVHATLFAPNGVLFIITIVALIIELTEGILMTLTHKEITHKATILQELFSNPKK